MDLTATTIIIPTIRARPDLLDTCITEVQRTMRDDDQLYVLEGGTFAQNCNAGAALVETDTMIFLNDDCKPDQDDWIERLLEPLAHLPNLDPMVGIVGCRLIYPTGYIQHAGVYLSDDGGVLMGHHYTHDQPSGPATAVTAACMAVRTSLFRDLNGFDEDFRNGNEDVDFCLRARSHGHTVWYESGVTLIHHESQSGAARWTHTRENIILLNERWRVETEPADAATEAPLGTL